MEAQTLREAVTSAIRYWEPRRFIYNIALTVVVLACFWLNYPVSKSTVSLDFVLLLFLLAVLANVAYCAAYVVDIFASGYRKQWWKLRIIFKIGLLFAAITIRFFALGFFGRK